MILHPELTFVMLMLATPGMNSFMLRVPCNRRAVLLRKNSPQHVKGTQTVLLGETSDVVDDESISKLYRDVAENDPEWFDEFVCGVLQEDELEEELGALLNLNTISQGGGVPKSSLHPARNVVLPVDRVRETVDSTDNDKKEWGRSSAKTNAAESSTPKDFAVFPPSEILGSNITKDESQPTNPPSIPALQPAEKTQSEDAANNDISSQLATNATLKESPWDGEKEEPSVIAENILPINISSCDQDETGNLPFVVTGPSSSKESAQSFIPLNVLESLGYSQGDIVALNPDAIALIAEERVKKPSAGIPEPWKSSQTESTVSIVKPPVEDSVYAKGRSKSEMVHSDRDAVAETTPLTTRDPAPNRSKMTEKKKRTRSLRDESSLQRDDSRLHSRNASPSVLSNCDLDADTPNKKYARTGHPSKNPESDSTIGRGTQRKKAASTRAKGVSPPRQRSGARIEERATRSSRKRPIYGGRGAPIGGTKSSRGDPPQSSSGRWPDIDSFREMLRHEARFRHRLLGDGMSDALKDESEWRLNLYKSWLWTLHDGLGTPVVESRSDRGRRWRNAKQESSSSRKNRIER